MAGRAPARRPSRPGPRSTSCCRPWSSCRCRSATQSYLVPAAGLVARDGTQRLADEPGVARRDRQQPHIGVPTALLLDGARHARGAWRWSAARFAARGWSSALVVAPMMLPHVILAIGLYPVMLELGLLGTHLAAIIGHTVVGDAAGLHHGGGGAARLRRRARAGGDDARRQRWQTFRHVTFPMIRPGMHRRRHPRLRLLVRRADAALFLTGADDAHPAAADLGAAQRLPHARPSRRLPRCVLLPSRSSCSRRSPRCMRRRLAARVRRADARHGARTAPELARGRRQALRRRAPRCARPISAIEPGEFFSLIGPSGSGKTTLLGITSPASSPPSRAHRDRRRGHRRACRPTGATSAWCSRTTPCSRT